MTNRGYRLICAAIITAGGGVTFLGSDGEEVGTILLVAGSVLCGIDWFASYKADKTDSSGDNNESKQ